MKRVVLWTWRGFKGMTVRGGGWTEARACGGGEVEEGGGVLVKQDEVMIDNTEQSPDAFCASFIQLFVLGFKTSCKRNLRLLNTFTSCYQP
ncbi:hypothetical protein QVD17_31165 [Tagetes erecta]|uniref:Uncharacterized protein n=1 Tax=Tagetes erecta TaxID=13708 RepID=A0AAD8NN72_TARER|nr:hypothetical protein QVD17_31165 [Tagetes erecta]